MSKTANGLQNALDGLNEAYSQWKLQVQLGGCSDSACSWVIPLQPGQPISTVMNSCPIKVMFDNHNDLIPVIKQTCHNESYYQKSCKPSQSCLPQLVPKTVKDAVFKQHAYVIDDADDPFHKSSSKTMPQLIMNICNSVKYKYSKKKCNTNFNNILEPPSREKVKPYVTVARIGLDRAYVPVLHIPALKSSVLPAAEYDQLVDDMCSALSVLPPNFWCKDTKVTLQTFPLAFAPAHCHNDGNIGQQVDDLVQTLFSPEAAKEPLPEIPLDDIDNFSSKLIDNNFQKQISCSLPSDQQQSTSCSPLNIQPTTPDSTCNTELCFDSSFEDIDFSVPLNENLSTPKVSPVKQITFNSYDSASRLPCELKNDKMEVDKIINELNYEQSNIILTDSGPVMSKNYADNLLTINENGKKTLDHLNRYKLVNSKQNMSKFPVPLALPNGSKCFVECAGASPCCQPHPLKAPGCFCCPPPRHLANPVFRPQKQKSVQFNKSTGQPACLERCLPNHVCSSCECAPFQMPSNQIKDSNRMNGSKNHSESQGIQQQRKLTLNNSLKNNCISKCYKGQQTHQKSSADNLLINERQQLAFISVENIDDESIKDVVNLIKNLPPYPDIIQVREKSKSDPSSVKYFDCRGNNFKYSEMPPFQNQKIIVQKAKSQMIDRSQEFTQQVLTTKPCKSIVTGHQTTSPACNLGQNLQLNTCSTKTNSSLKPFHSSGKQTNGFTDCYYSEFKSQQAQVFSNTPQKSDFVMSTAKIDELHQHPDVTYLKTHGGHKINNHSVPNVLRKQQSSQIPQTSMQQCPNQSYTPSKLRNNSLSNDQFAAKTKNHLSKVSNIARQKVEGKENMAPTQVCSDQVKKQLKHGTERGYTVSQTSVPNENLIDRKEGTYPVKRPSPTPDAGRTVLKYQKIDSECSRLPKT